jgi:hypothetical protein
MDGKVVIVDVNNKSFVQCWTEGNVIFLSKDVLNAQLFNSGSSAQAWISAHVPDIDRFLADEDQEEVSNVHLVACKVEARFKFIPV